MLWESYGTVYYNRFPGDRDPLSTLGPVVMKDYPASFRPGVAGSIGLVVMVVIAGVRTGVVRGTVGTGKGEGVVIVHPAVTITARMRKISIVPDQFFIPDYQRVSGLNHFVEFHILKNPKSRK